MKNYAVQAKVRLINNEVIDIVVVLRLENKPTVDDVRNHIMATGYFKVSEVATVETKFISQFFIVDYKEIEENQK